MAEDFKSRLARLREQQQGPALTITEIVDALCQQLQPHVDHPWQQVGRCVMCGPCGVRLYQGSIPDDHPRYVPPAKPRNDLLTRFRDRWKVTP